MTPHLIVTSLAAIALTASSLTASAGVDPTVRSTSRAAIAVAADCEKPSDLLDLTDWKLQLPTGDEEDPDEVKQPALDSYSDDPWFTVTDSCDGVQFRAAVNGVTTSGSKYPRSELREMSDGDEASWSTSKGRHSMTIDQTVTSLPNDKPQFVVGQIHGGDDDLTVFRVDGTKLYVTNGDNSRFFLVTDTFELGTRFQVGFVAENGKIAAYYNGTKVVTLSVSDSSAYFKAGAYTQANCDNSSPCDDDNYGEVIIHSLRVESRS